MVATEMKSEKPSLLYFPRRSLDGFEATIYGSFQMSMQGRSDPCGVGTKELCTDEVPGLLSHNSSWKATCDDFELADFHLAASQEGSAAVD